MSLSPDIRRRLFKSIYDNNQWGRAPVGRRFYSDSPPQHTGPYREFVAQFIRDRGIRTVIDLGCGDFEVSSGIDLGSATYTGVDLYDELIEDNRRRYECDGRTFLVRDLIEDDLPAGDLALLTLVLYLLPDAELFRILAKLDRYQYVLITDGMPDIAPHERRNVDKSLDKYPRPGGLFLELPPFNKNVTEVLRYQLPSGEVIRTVLLDTAASTSLPARGEGHDGGG